jgi:eukaryotic-like serine/threonine-protein kinase
VTDALSRLTSALADRYRIERELGQGGMATVYLAQDLKHDRQVAVKVLKPELAAVLGADRFVQEIKTTAALQHPHILPLFDSGSADGFLYYVMPYIQGETLRTKLDREHQLGVTEAVKITTEVADALDYAHRHGVIHRDIKPENILLHDGRPMVADFGIALAVSAAAGGRMTETGLSLGTPHYMSPEQATAEKEITARSDVYSLASVLYEILTGNPPHTGASAQQIIMKIIAEPVPVVTSLRKSVPPNVAAALTQALEKLPADRFESARAFATALANPAFTSTTTMVQATARPRRGVLATFAVLTVVAAFAAWFVGRATAPGPELVDVGLPDTAQFAFGDEGPYAAESPSLAVSPAGDFIVYMARRGQGTELWYRSLRGPEARPLPGTRGGNQPVLSPDGRWIAFESGGLLKKVPVDGSAAAASVAEVTTPNGITWIRNDETIVGDVFGSRTVRFRMTDGARLDSGGACASPSPVPGTNDLLCSGGNILLAVAGSGDRRLPPARFSGVPLGDSSRPVMSDQGLVLGSHLLFVDAQGNLTAAPYDPRSRRVGPQRIVQHGMRRSLFNFSSHFGVTRDGDLVFVPGSNGGIGEFVAAELSGASRTLPMPPKQYVDFAISADGQRLATTEVGVSGMELWVYGVTSGQGDRLAVAPYITPPVWSPDGSIAFAQTRAWSDTALYAMILRPGSPNPIRLVDIPFVPSTFASPTTLVGVTGSSGADIVTLTLGGARVHADTLRIPNSAEVPTMVSPDRQWLAYSGTQRGLSQVFVAPFPGLGRQYKVSVDVGSEPLWLPDGSLLYRVGHCWKRLPRRSGAEPPLGAPLQAFCDERFLNTPGLSNVVTPDGHIVYLRSMAPTTAGYVRIIRHWRQRVLEGTSPQ